MPQFCSFVSFTWLRFRVESQNDCDGSVRVVSTSIFNCLTTDDDRRVRWLVRFGRWRCCPRTTPSLDVVSRQTHTSRIVDEVIRVAVQRVPCRIAQPLGQLGAALVLVGEYLRVTVIETRQFQDVFNQLLQEVDLGLN